MCGIAGIVDLAGQRSLSRARLSAMTDLLAHRGPDGSGHHCVPGLALGHRRLAIIDIASGQQPMLDGAGRLALVFNGEIYNYRELMTDLAARGHRFRTRSDSETILHAWTEWGEACVEHLDGMFAFALWDAERRTLFLARDRLGKKPLYYGLRPDGVMAFASEIGAVVSAFDRPPEIDPQAVEEYFAYGYVPDPRSIFRGIAKLPPGHRLTVRRGAASLPEPVAYWDVAFVPGEDRGAGAIEADLLERLDGAVRSRLLAEVPLGAFLSGGVDSGGVVALMARATDSPVRTCSIGFRDPRLDESARAAAVARRYHTEHHAETVDVDAYALVDRLATAYGEPFADSSALPTFVLSRVARRHVTVALSGDGGDEVFAGYRRYRLYRAEERARDLLPQGVSRRLFGVLGRCYPKLDWAPRWLRGKATFEALATDPVGGYFRSVTLLPTPLRHRLYDDGFRAALDGYDAVEVLRRHAATGAATDALGRAQYLDLKTWLPGGMLTKVDRASMANGLEVRCPFLDHRLVEWASRLPVAARVRGSQGKVALKRALETLLPNEILYRPKQGFTMPLARWLRGDLGARLREGADGSGHGGSGLGGAGMLDPEMLRRLLREHERGLADHSRALWSVVMFDAFLRQDWQRHRQPMVEEVQHAAQ